MTNVFGAFLKEQRLKRGMSLRTFCLEKGFDPGNYSRLERGLLPPPQNDEKLEQYAAALEIEHGSDDWLELYDRAAAARGEFPKDLLQDAEIVERLPVLFRTLRGQSVAPEKLDELVERIRRS